LFFVVGSMAMWWGGGHMLVFLSDRLFFHPLFNLACLIPLGGCPGCLAVCLVELLESTSRLAPQNLNQRDFLDIRLSKRARFPYVQFPQRVTATRDQLPSRWLPNFDENYPLPLDKWYRFAVLSSKTERSRASCLLPLRETECSPGG
jgi:hypothetical protein